MLAPNVPRLARWVPDARDIADELTAKGVKLSRNGSGYDPADPVGKLLFTTLSMVAEFEADLIAARTREGMAIAKAKGRLKGKKPKLGRVKEKHLVQLHADGTRPMTDM
jgi:DNA invertase Pin-like site-specific DNA recombinase